MNRHNLPFGTWTWGQVTLILGPVLLAIILVALYLVGMLPIGLPGLLVAVVLVNLAGELVYAWRNERSAACDRTRLRNDVVGSRVVADREFTGDCRPYRGTVALGAERWQAVSQRRIRAGDRVAVVRRRGLVLEVSPEP